MHKRTYRKEYKWNEKIYRNNKHINLETGVEYDLSHMLPMSATLVFEYKNEENEKVKGEITANVIFDPHCYTSEIVENDPRPTLVTDIYSDGTTSIRGFDINRYNYSKNLPLIIKGLSHKMCKESTIFGKAIRLEQQDKQNPKKGVYILLKTRINKKSKLEIFVETAHYRNNEPHEANLKKPPKKYMLILGDIIKAQK